MSNVVKRHTDPYGPALLLELEETGLTLWPALRVFGYLQDATIDDIAQLAGVERQAIVDIVWDEWEERAIKDLRVTSPFERVKLSELMD